MRTTSLVTLVVSPWLLASPLCAQDSAFHAMNERGRSAMGVDQYTSWHHFDLLPDGGRIALERDSTDTLGRAAIRAHLAHIAQTFAAGDFALPGFVHAGEVPGTRVMTARRSVIRYVFHPLAGGGEMRIITDDPDARAAVHAFLAFQAHEHRVADHHPAP